MLDQVDEAGLDIVSLDEAVARLREDDERRFVCFTFDQGYRDLAHHAYPLFQRRSLPLTVYVATDYASGWGELWWLALEEVVAKGPGDRALPPRRLMAAAQRHRLREAA